MKIVSAHKVEQNSLSTVNGVDFWSKKLSFRFWFGESLAKVLLSWAYLLFVVYVAAAA